MLAFFFEKFKFKLNFQGVILKKNNEGSVEAWVSYVIDE